MKTSGSHAFLVVSVTFFVAFYLSAIPMSKLELARPDYVGMLVIYWVLCLPERAGIFLAFFIGVLFDTLMGSTLGLYSFVYSMLAYIVILLRTRLQMYPFAQQALVVFLLLGVTHVIAQWLKIGVRPVVYGKLHIWPAFTSALIWPLVYKLLQSIQIYFRVN